MKRFSLRAQGLETCGFFVVRRPLLSWAEFEKWCASGTDNVPTTGLRTGLRQIVERPEIREALQVASEELVRDIPVWLTDPTSEHGRRVEQALVRYVSRMCGRATPFGLFAGFSTGTLAAETSLGPTVPTWERRVRFDMGYLGEIVRVLANDRVLRLEYRYTVNSTVYACGRGYRWVEIDSGGQRREHRLAFVEQDPVVDALLATGGTPRTWAELVGQIAETDPDCDGAEDYIHGAIDAQLLVPDIEPPLTGESPAAWLAARLATINAPRAATTRLWLQTAIAQMDEVRARPLGADHVYSDLLATMAAGPIAGVGLRQLQIDLHTVAPEITLDEQQFEDAIAEFPRLWSLFIADPPRQIRDFIDRFSERFGDAEVPLMLALDPDAGVGYGSLDFPPTPLLDELNLATLGPPASARSAIDDFCDRRLRELARAGDREWVITDAELKAMEEMRQPSGGPGSPAERFPESIHVKCVLLAADRDAARVGDYVVHIEHAIGPTATRVLSRFASHDAQLAEALAALAEHEARLVRGAVVAEIIHLAVDRLGNVLLRPALRKHEIAVLAPTSVSPEDSIPVSDLLVRVEGGAVFLRSRRLGVDVVARNSTAHNFTARMNIPVYRFLCDLQHCGPSTMRWPLMGVVQPPFLPRVRYRRMILRPATWFLDDAAKRRVVDATAPGAALTAWATEHKVPTRAGFYLDENVLPVDFANPLSAASAAKLLRTAARPMFVELWPESLPPVTHHNASPFMHELMVPLRRRTARPVGVGHPRSALPLPDIERGTFMPGSEWLYVRLYCGEASADLVMGSVVCPWIAELRAANHFDEWHYLRYSDSANHIRVRLHGRTDVMATAMARLPLHLDRRLVWRVDLGTYVRECGRYGGMEAIALVEHLFTLDSDACLSILVSAQDDARRWRAALAGISTLLDDAGLSVAQSIEFLERHRDAYAREFGVGSLHRQAVGARYRNSIDTIDAVLGRTPADPEVALVRDAFGRRSAAAGPTWSKLHTLARDGRLVGEVEPIVASLLHMHVNRLLRSRQRAQEFVLTDILLRYRRMLHANAGRSGPALEPGRG